MKKNIVIKSSLNVEDLKKGCVYSFLNPYSIIKVLIPKAGNHELLLDKLVFFVDGWLLSLIICLLTFKKVSRNSFDYTSIAPIIFQNIVKRKEKLAVIGGTDSEIADFIDILKKEYKEIDVIYFTSGYFNQGLNSKIISDIKNSKATIVLLGLGTPKQESFGLEILNQQNDLIVFTCGGFISQTYLFKKLNYYPHWVNRFNLRAFHRFFKEPHTRKRYVLSYSKNIFTVFRLFFTHKLRFTIK